MTAPTMTKKGDVWHRPHVADGWLVVEARYDGDPIGDTIGSFYSEQHAKLFVAALTRGPASSDVTLTAGQAKAIACLLRDLPSDAWLTHRARITAAIAALEQAPAPETREQAGGCEKECAAPGPFKGPECLATKHGLRFASDAWCECRCHKAPQSEQAGGEAAARIAKIREVLTAYVYSSHSATTVAEGKHSTPFCQTCLDQYLAGQQALRLLDELEAPPSTPSPAHGACRHAEVIRAKVLEQYDGDTCTENSSKAHRCGCVHAVLEAVESALAQPCTPAQQPAPVPGGELPKKKPKRKATNRERCRDCMGRGDGTCSYCDGSGWKRKAAAR